MLNMMDLEFFNSSSSSDDEFLFESGDETYIDDKERPKNQYYFGTMVR